MIILRNKIYTALDSSKELNKRSAPKELDGLDIQSSAGPYRSPLGESSSNISIGGATQGFRQIGRVGNTLEKTMSDTPMGINYVDSAQTRPKKKSRLGRILRRGSKSTLNKANQILEDLPVMSEESKIKQRRKLRAIDFYVDSASNGLDNVAERIYSEERMPVSSADMRKAETDGVVQRRPDGKWGIIAKRKRLWWSAGYDSRESAEAALRAYHAGRH